MANVRNFLFLEFFPSNGDLGLLVTERFNRIEVSGFTRRVIAEEDTDCGREQETARYGGLVKVALANARESEISSENWNLARGCSGDSACDAEEDGLAEELQQDVQPVVLESPFGDLSRDSVSVTETRRMFIIPMPPTTSESTEATVASML